MRLAALAVFGLLASTACSSTRSPATTPVGTCNNQPPLEAQDECAALCQLDASCSSGSPVDVAQCQDSCVQQWRGLQDCIACIGTRGCEGIVACGDTCRNVCNFGTDCKDGEVCSEVVHRCMTRECFTTSDCPCVGACISGQCEPPQCYADSDCLDSESCQDRVCQPEPCNRNDDCRTGTCGPIGNSCGPQSCYSDIQCNTAQKCVISTGQTWGWCVDTSCTSVKDCPAGTRCSLEGFCRP